MLRLILPVILLALIGLNLWVYHQMQVREVEYAYIASVDKHRQDKLQHLLREDSTPLKDFELFAGLRYYPVKRAYRISATFEPRRDTASILKTNKKSKIRLTWVGNLTFKTTDTVCTLRAYSVPWDSVTTNRYDVKTKRGLVVVPFRDSTNGRGTSKFGRYLDVQINGDSTVWLDFNLAYNAYSLYNPWYISPKAPKVNFLPLWIEAGERTYLMPEQQTDRKRLIK